MNERIKEKISEISQKARQHANEYVDDEVESQYELKFAELIVKGCLGDHKERIATRYQGSDYDRAVAYGMEIVYMDIVEKFGVE